MFQPQFITQRTSEGDWKLFKDHAYSDDSEVVECHFDYKFFGGNQQMGLLKTFYLPPHYKLRLKFRMFFSNQIDIQMSTIFR
ncbi:unnamed protein product [Paramecium octaurelia]|uniref:Uncharacterized protein n=1 Tax=Paramecium octaurelia TaxID=43137 RepID=A0A8S1YPC7_PAROT|nr:unnamed protein product [Paramecium octaurelia]